MERSDGVVTIRTPTEADVGPVARAVAESLAALAPWMPWATSEYGEDHARRWVRGELGLGEHPFVIEAEGAIVGSCGLNRLDELNRYANLGYWVHTNRTGRGHATRAARLLACYGFDDVGLARIEIVMSVENHASRRVAERLGAHHEGIMRDRLLLDGRHHDAHLFSLVPGEA